MKKTLPLYLGPSVIGSVICDEEDVYIKLFAKTYAKLSGICRAYVRGNDGALLIGVLAPDGTGFSAEKNISRSALAAEGLSFDEITYAYALKTALPTRQETSSWQRMDTVPELLCRDDVVCELAKSTDALCNNVSAPSAVAIRLNFDRPFPRPDVLCLLTPRKINGFLYGVIGITESGMPKRL